VCGNGIVEPGEQCDDGNLVDGDGCSSTCQVEPRCANGVVEAGEQCDDGNVVNGDGCSASCQLEGCTAGLTGTWDGGPFGIQFRWNIIEDAAGNLVGDYYLVAASGSPYGGLLTGTHAGAMVTMGLVGTASDCDTIHFSDFGGFTLTRVASTVCGNGVLEPGEQCDDGNLVDGDGCDHNCGIPGCPNGHLDPGEECDDGNLIDNDGCARNCTLPRCGNGILETGEQCDDGNTRDCDGCSHDCQVETDPDRDGILGSCDNCPFDYNPSQRDRDQNGIGDACDVPVVLNTAAGSNIIIGQDTGEVPSLVPNPIQAIAITYSDVSAAGVTEILQLEAPVGTVLDANFKVSGLGALLHLTTSASTSGLIHVCITYDDVGLSAEEEAALVFLHEESGVLVDRTSFHDVTANILCADVTSFSMFGIGVPVGAVERLRSTFHLDRSKLGKDRILRLRAKFVPASGTIFDPTLSGAGVTVMRDGVTLFTRTIPPLQWRRVGRRAIFRFSDRKGVLVPGVTSATLSKSKRGTVAFRILANGLDLRGTDSPRLDIRYDLGAATFTVSSSCVTKGLAKNKYAGRG